LATTFATSSPNTSVARMTTTAGLLRRHSGDTSATHSTAPTSPATTTPPTAASGYGMPCTLYSQYVAIPPTITNAPWAKFTMPVVR
jgi:hypothetical protein